MRIASALVPLVFAALVLLVFVRAGAAESRPWPLLSGDFEGAISLRDAPEIHWRTSTRTLTPNSSGRANETMTEISLEAEDLSARARIRWNNTTDEAAWELLSCSIKLGRWLPALVAKFGGSSGLGDRVVEGILHARGSGSFRDGKMDQSGLSLDLDDGAMRSEELKTTMTGIALHAEIRDLAALLSTPGQSLAIQSVSVGEVSVKNVSVKFSLVAGRRLRIEEASGEVFHGHISLKETDFSTDFSTSETRSATFQVAKFDLGELAALMPKALAGATGELNGFMGVNWSPQDGFTLGDGALKVDPAQPAEATLAARPGFLTDQIPAKISLVPAGLGPIARWLSPPNPAYKTLEAIELGKLPLMIETLAVHIHPAGDDRGRTARVLVAARPRQGSAVEKLSFEINVAGPLDQVLKLGLNDRVAVSAGH